MLSKSGRDVVYLKSTILMCVYIDTVDEVLRNREYKHI